MSSFDFSFGDVIDESVERAGLDPAALTHRHLSSITRSLQLLFIDLETDGAQAEYRLETQAYDIDSGDGGVVLDSDTIDVTQAAIVIDGKPVPLGRSTREDFLNLSFPTATGAPSVFFLMKSDPNTDAALPENITGSATSDTPVLVLWPQMGLSGTVTVNVTRIRQHAMPSNLGEELDTRRSMLPTIVAGLAAAIAGKYNPEMFDSLDGIYRDMKMRRLGDEDHHPIVVAFRGPGWGRSRRH